MIDHDFWYKRRVLITGAAGFLGANLAMTLVDLGADVLGFDLGPGPAWKVFKLESRSDAYLSEGNVVEHRAMDHLINTFERDVVFHLAGYSHIAASDASPTSAFSVNVVGTVEALEACRRAKEPVKAFVLASSNHVYGPQNRWPVTEEAPMNQTDFYGATKTAADLFTRAYARRYGLPAVCLRHVNAFGPADPHRSHLVTGTILSLLRGDRPVIRSDGRPTKGYLHVDDVVRAYLVAAQEAARWAGHAFNVAPEAPSTVLEVVSTLMAIAGMPGLPTIEHSDHTQDGYYEALDSTRIRERGWRDLVSLDGGLRQTWEWYTRHGEGWMDA